MESNSSRYPYVKLRRVFVPTKMERSGTNRGQLNVHGDQRTIANFRTNGPNPQPSWSTSTSIRQRPAKVRRMEVKATPPYVKDRVRRMLIKRYPEKGMEVEKLAATYYSVFDERLDPLCYGFYTMEEFLRNIEFKGYVKVRKRPNTTICMVKGIKRNDVATANTPERETPATPVPVSVPVPILPSAEVNENNTQQQKEADDDKKNVDEGTTLVIDYAHGQANPKEYVVPGMAKAEVIPSTSAVQTLLSMGDRRPDEPEINQNLVNSLASPNLKNQSIVDTIGVTAPLSLFGYGYATQNAFLVSSLNSGFRPMLAQETLIVNNAALLTLPSVSAAQDGSHRSRSHRSNDRKRPVQVDSWRFAEQENEIDQQDCSVDLKKEAFKLTVSKRKWTSMADLAFYQEIREINPFVLHINGLPNDIPWEKFQREFPKAISGVYKSVATRSRFSGKSFCNLRFRSPKDAMKAFKAAKDFVAKSWRIPDPERKKIYIGFGKLNWKPKY